jgi:tRNA modification GTPase
MMGRRPFFDQKFSKGPMVSRETSDTIVAIATAPGRAGVGVVRVSGPASSRIRDKIAGPGVGDRVATFRRFCDAAGEMIDEGLTLFFRGPRSYTGEDTVEFQCHGGHAVLSIIVHSCLALGCRLANPGEFTERAFHNGKLDLAQAEAVADLIEASSEAAAKSAAKTLTGEFSARINSLAGTITTLRMHVEACIDFPDEEIDAADRGALENQLSALRKAVDELRRVAIAGAVLRDGLMVVLIGRPNVGKSSLLNRLAGEDLAIVTAVPGTTRDVVRATIHLDGLPIHLVDTAGLRQTIDAVEQIGIERTWQSIQSAGAALFVVEAGEGVGAAEEAILARLPSGIPVLVVNNKIDLLARAEVPRETSPAVGGASLAVSALTGEGIQELRDWLLKVSGWEPQIEGVFMARERHLHALSSVAAHLANAAERQNQFELLAEELRLAHAELSRITGQFSVDDLLGEIFSRFCVGK